MTAILHDPTIPADPAAAACPDWCTQHDAMLDSDDSTLVIHRATVDVAGYHVGSRLGVFVETDGSLTIDPVEVVIDGQAVAVAEARQLIARLTLAVELASGGVR